MIDPQRLLGSMLKQSLKGGRRRKSSSMGNLFGGAMTGAVGLGALGVAIAAFEHFTQKGSGQGRQSGPSQPPPTPRAPAAPPPPPPGQSPGKAAPSPPPAPAETISEERASLLIDAMVAAANADGTIDEKEKKAILDRLEQSGAAPEERELVRRSIEAPPGIDAILSRVNSPELAVQVYAVSLAAIDVDTNVERAYLEYLRNRLDVDDQVVRQLHEQFGIEASNP